jgi:hypothetical protein
MTFFHRPVGLVELLILYARVQFYTPRDTFKFEEYLHIKKFTYRQILCKFRISAHSLRIETGRYEKTKDSSGNYSKLEKENRICKLL